MGAIWRSGRRQRLGLAREHIDVVATTTKVAEELWAAFEAMARTPARVDERVERLAAGFGVVGRGRRATGDVDRRGAGLGRGLRGG
jgi:hypothetical protein